MKDKRSLSLSQKRFWLEWKWARSQAAYNTPLMFELEGFLHVNALEKALHYFVNNYDEGCRTTFEASEEEVYRVIHDQVPMVLEKIDGPIDMLPLLRHAFDLTKLPLFKFVLVKLNEHKHLLLLNFHHIISDALSAKYFIDFLSYCYNNLLAFDSIAYPKNITQVFEAHVEFEKKHTDEINDALSLLYWENLLRTRKLSIDLPKKTADNPHDEADSIYSTLDNEQTRLLKAFSKRMATTPSIVLSAVFGALLARYSGESHVVLNYPVDMRRSFSKKTIGCFVNHIPCLVDIQPLDSFTSLINKLTEQRKATKPHQYSSLMDIVAHLRKKQILESDEFLNVSITEAQLKPIPLSFEGLRVKTLPCTSQTMTNTLDLSYQLDDSLSVRLDYRTGFFDKTFMNQFLNHYFQLLMVCIKESDQVIHSLNFFDEAEHAILKAWENQALIAPTTETILSLFASQVEKTPNQIALISDKQELTYDQLDKMSSCFAKYLLVHYKTCYGHTMPKGGLIGISLPRGADLVIAILSVLKTGSAYVPLDPTYPFNRLQDMVEDSRIALLVANAPLACFPHDARRLALFTEDLSDAEDALLPDFPLLSDLAYVLYTSGSTGKPKGVMIEHESLSNVVLAFKQQLNVTQSDCWASVTSPNFDIFGLELFLPLIAGCKLVLISPMLLEEPSKLVDYLNCVSPTIIQATPSFWSMLFLLDWKGDSNELTILSGGESLSEQLTSYLLTCAKRVFNVYGPTETTIWSTCHRIMPMQSARIIGQPIRNTVVCVLDKALQRVPVGVAGELYIAGSGVARGYWNKSEEDLQQAFPLLCLEGETKRFYRTGDLVAWMPDGLLEYRGRFDSQVKIRGHRIELAEIETLILQHPNAWQCVVVAQGQLNEQSLLAFVIPIQNEVLDEEQLTNYLQQKLPSHALPRAIVIQAFPLLPNGKIDKKALMVLANLQQNKTRAKPSTVEESILLEVWQALFPKISLSVDDHFFKLGGHSLQAVQLSVRLQALFAIEVPVRKIREYPTIQRLASWISEQKNTCFAVPQPSSKKQQGPLSLSQRYLWIIDKTEEQGSAHYNLLFAQKLTGQLNLHAMTASVNSLIARHDALRTTYVEENGKIVQKVGPFIPITLHLESIEESSLERLLAEDVQRRFNLNEYPILRVRILRVSNTETLLLFCLPHIAIDGWSLNSLKEELTQFYQHFVKGGPLKLKRPSHQYLDFVEWQRNTLQGEYLTRLEQFWQKTLSGHQPMTLPIDKQRAPVFTHRGDIYRFQISPLRLTQLQALAIVHEVTLFTLCLSAFAIVLYKYSNQNDLIIGTACANRMAQPFEETIGLFINTIALRLTLDNEMKATTLFQQAMDVTMAAHDNQALPFEAVVDLLQANRDASRPPLVQVMLVLQSANEDYHLALEGLTAQTIPVNTGSSKFELMMTLHETAAGLEAEIEFANDLFSKATIVRLAEHFQQVLGHFTQSSHEAISRLNILTPKETHLLLSQWNRPSCDYQSTKTLDQLFAERVAKHPHKCALRFGKESTSYLQLDNQANQLAQLLLIKCEGRLPPDTLIGICVDREPAMVVAILAVLKVGAAYVPLDPNYPSERLKFIIKDSALSYLITRQSFINEHAFYDSLDAKQLIDLQDISMEQPCAPVHANNKASSLAYVIYTSGSTGEPKGALMTHANVTRLFAATDSLFDFQSSDVWCLFHSFAFDFSVWEIWGALLHSASLVIVPYEISRNTQSFRHLLKEEQVSVLNQTPSAFLRLIQEENKCVDTLALRYVIFGGEALNPRSLSQWVEKYGINNPALINMYGITETTVHVTWHLITEKEIKEGHGSNIGKPLPDLNAYVLDTFGELVPVGVPGELYLSGPGLCRGYLNREDLTRKVFLTFEDNIRRYKTGDMVRWLPDGCLEYLGRKDKQVKVNGFRIEIGEIESVLLQWKAIKEALVTVSEDKRLIAYYTTSTHAVDEEFLDNFLREQLPEYMVPSYYIPLDRFRMTVNGKIDFAKLPLPNPNIRKKARVAPRSALEKRLAGIWTEVLGVNDLSVYDNFFALGGDSMLTISVVTRARAQGLKLAAKSLFRYPTIASLALHVADEDVNEIPPMQLAPFELLNEADKGQVLSSWEDVYPLTELQKGMVYHSEMNQESSTYIDVISCYLTGNFNKEHFKQGLAHCIAQHPVLRTSFDLSGFSSPMQIVHSDIPSACQIITLQHLDEKEQQVLLNQWLSQEIKTHFDLKKAPLWRITLHHLNTNTYHFSLTCHHAILDGWSVALFITQLFEQYEQRVLETIICKPKRLQAQYSHYVAEEIGRIQSLQQKMFWQDKLQEVQPNLLAQPTATIANSSLKRVLLDVPLTLSQRLFEVAVAYQCNVDNVLLAVHLWVLSQLTGQDSVITGIATHGRSENTEGDKVLGLFLNSTPFHITMQAENWSDLVNHIIQEKVHLTDFGQFPLSKIQQLKGNQPLFDTLFNFVNFYAFDALKGLQTLKIKAGKTYEETNYTLVAQTGINPESKQLEYQLIYLSNKLNPEQMQVIQALYQNALHSVAFDTTLPGVDTLRPYLSWMQHNTQEKTYLHQTVHALFDEQVQLYPHHIALIDDEGSMTYLELQKQANRMANCLRQYCLNTYQEELCPDRLIGISLEPGRKFILTLLAILKAGAAYLPLDKTYEPERLQAMVDYVAPRMIIVDDIFPVQALQPICIPYDWLAIQPIDESVKHVGNENNLAYIMFTSGSTGMPKAVMIEHHSIVRLVKNTNYITIQTDDVIAQASNPNFDAFTFEVWGALLNGASLQCVPRATLLNIKAFAHFLLDAKVSILWLTARLLDQFVAAGHASMFRKLRYLLAGGDILNKSSLAAILHCKEGRPQRILNGYGPTENTTFSTAYEITKESLTYPSIPIGIPISNTQIYVLSSALKPIPTGFVGELYLGGAGLARGYYQNEALTKQHFIAHPFITGERVYKTGDNVIALPNGELLFLGRSDRQLKVRGFRIELDEIERLIITHPQIAQCVIVAQEGAGDKQLVAYCVQQGDIRLEQLWGDLRQIMPAHLQPTRIVLLDTLPLTPNGKLDLARLPNKETHTLSILETKTEIEAQVQSIWCRVLELDKISIKDNFFDLGGNSLLVVQLHSLIQESFEQVVSVTDIFHYPTIQRFAAFLSGHQQHNSTREGDIRAKRSAFRHQQRLKTKRPEYV